MQRAGATHLPRATWQPQPEADASERASDVDVRRSARKDELTVTVSDHTAATNTSSTESYDGPSLSSKQRPPALQVIAKEVAVCTLCQELAAHRTQTVFGVGDPDARLCFLGEAPGKDEDRIGEPFVGAAGKLLNKIIENGLGIKRDEVYILNVCKCRPQGNRTPTTEEAQNCRGFLDGQLAIIRPEYICCLGLTAAQSLLDTTESLGRLRGRFHRHLGSKVICTYHPAYLLRMPSAKKAVWEDMKILMRDMGLPMPEDD